MSIEQNVLELATTYSNYKFNTMWLSAWALVFRGSRAILSRRLRIALIDAHLEQVQIQVQ